ncbi:hypothetical protein [Verticiella sediminum]|nr:hypothetical protein [Verticiella sediminum]
MKMQITFNKTDGSTGMALVDGVVNDPIEARRELVAALDLPDASDHNDADARLRAAGIEPASVQVVPLVE